MEVVYNISKKINSKAMPLKAFWLGNHHPLQVVFSHVVSGYSWALGIITNLSIAIMGLQLKASFLVRLNGALGAV